eukprot:GHVH01009259.1.p1 GENE.GHVH01009259.1~~GHVH01009259.1.p1  ORF type:complete len:600 (+),score=66.05 GHVH01009259.1:801-2600(+)
MRPIDVSGKSRLRVHVPSSEDEKPTSKLAIIEASWKIHGSIAIPNVHEPSILSSQQGTIGMTLSKRQGIVNGLGRLLFCKGRPVNGPPSLHAAINEEYKLLSSKKTGAYVFVIEAPSSLIDVNVTPDKQTLVYNSTFERQLVHAVRTALKETLSGCIEGSSMNAADSPERPRKRVRTTATPNYCTPHQVEHEDRSTTKRFISSNPPPTIELNKSNDLDSVDLRDSSHLPVMITPVCSSSIIQRGESCSSACQEVLSILSQPIMTPMTTLVAEHAATPHQLDPGIWAEDYLKSIENIQYWNSTPPQPTLNMSTGFIGGSSELVMSLTHSSTESYSILDEIKSVMDDRVVQLPKFAFENMVVHGQFNKGFIITTLPGTKPNRLVFLIDQHASDEKARFENLEKNLKLKKQQLLVPHKALFPLSMRSWLNHQFIADPDGIVSKLLAEGFSITTNSDGEFLLHTKPVVMGQQLEVEDLIQMVDLLMESEQQSSMTFDAVNSGAASRPSRFGTHSLSQTTSHLDLVEEAWRSKPWGRIRPPRTWFILASRSCRGAIMIGTVLSLKKMYHVVKNMTLLKQPWNCPHGRPTCRLVSRVKMKVPKNS